MVDKIFTCFRSKMKIKVTYVVLVSLDQSALSGQIDSNSATKISALVLEKSKEFEQQLKAF